MKSILIRAVISTRKIIFLLALALIGVALRAGAQGGVPLWTNLYDGPVSGADQAYAIAADPSGNVIVTGDATTTPTNSLNALVTVKYSSAGVPLWTNSGGGVMCVNGSGEIFTTAGYPVPNPYYFTTEYTTVAWSGSGVPLWTNTYLYSAAPNNPAAITLDSSGNVVVTGSIFGGQFHYDYATVAYSSAGTPLWTNLYNGGSPVQLNAYATGIAADSNGNVFVTGYSMAGRGANGYDYTTIKYSATGSQLWINRYNGDGNGDDNPHGIAVDQTGNVFVTGSSLNINSNYDYVTVAYSNAGLPLWTNHYDGGNGNNYARGIAMDRSGNVFVTGYSMGGKGNYDYATVAYSNGGLPLWTNLYHGKKDGDDRVTAMGVDSGGNVFVTGYLSNSAYYGYATVAYSNAGLPLWTNVFNAGTIYYSQANALAVDPVGNVIVTGYSGIGTGGMDYTTIKYSSILPPPVQLGFQLTGDQLLLNWTNPGFLLQSAPNVAGPFTNVPGATSPYTNSTSAPQQFFRLISD